MPPGSLSEASVPTRRPSRQRKGLPAGGAVRAPAPADHRPRTNPGCPLRRPHARSVCLSLPLLPGPGQSALLVPPSLCETSLKCRLLTAVSPQSVAGDGDASWHRFQRPAGSGHTRLMFLCGCSSLTSGATSGSYIPPGDRSSFWFGHAVSARLGNAGRVWGTGGGGWWAVRP